MDNPARQWAFGYEDVSIATRLLRWIDLNQIPYEMNLNHTRFWLISSGPLYTEFSLRWADYCSPVTNPIL
jgi:hypothetical protein